MISHFQLCSLISLFITKDNKTLFICLFVDLFQMLGSSSQRVAGTDGSDFKHREHIPRQYVVSAETKTTLKRLIYAHFLLAFLVIVQVLLYHLPFLASFTVPRPHLWQYFWLITIIPSLCGLLSMKRNQVGFMQIFFRGTVTFGLGTILTTIILNLSELFTFKQLKTNHQLEERDPETFLGFPLLVLWYIFLIIVVQIHAFSLYMANTLLRSWQSYKTSKTN